MGATLSLSCLDEPCHSTYSPVTASLAALGVGTGALCHGSSTLIWGLLASSPLL